MNKVESEAPILGRFHRQVRFRCSDSVIAIVLTLTAFIAAFGYLSNTGVKEFYEIYFSPAVNFACTGNYAALDTEKPALAPLAKFLSREREKFDCSELPSDVARYIRPADLVENIGLYLIGTAGILWRMFGVSWSALVLLGAALTAAFTVSVYALSRLFVDRVAAVAVTMMATLSPVHTYMMPALRDYSKAPVIVAGVFFIGAGVLSERRGLLFLCSVLAGIVAGIGFGFRTDAALLVPFYALVSIIMMVGKRAHARLTLVSAFLLFFISFFLAAAPVIIAAYGQGGIFGHVALLGLMTPFNEPMGITSAFYDLGSFYSDRFVSATIHAHDSLQRRSEYQPFVFNDPAYNRAAIRTFLDYAVNFPADLLVRAYASILHVVDLRPSEAGFTALWPIQKIREIIVSVVFGPLAFLGAIFLMAVRRPLSAVYLALIVVWFAGSVAIQFHSRHGFYLEFVYWLALALLGVGLFDVLRRWRRSPSNIAFKPRNLFELVVIIAIMGVGLGVARPLQSARVATLVDKYEAADTVPVTLRSVPRSDWVLLTPEGKIPDFVGRIADFGEAVPAQYYLQLKLDLAHCPGQILNLTVKYFAPGPTYDFSRTFRLSTGGDDRATQIFLPVSRLDQSVFEGFLLPNKQVGCIRSLSAIKNTKELPLPLFLVLPPKWSEEPRFQTLKSFFGWQSLPKSRLLNTSPPRLLDLAEAKQLVVTPFGSDAWTFVDRNGRVTRDGAVFDGLTFRRKGYAAVTKLMHLKKGDILAARGEGTTRASLGVLDARGRWAQQVPVPAGHFLSAVEILDDGDYQVVLSHDIDGTWPYSNVDFEQVGLIKAPPMLNEEHDDAR